MTPSDEYRIAFVIYDGLTLLDFIGVYDPLTRLKTMGFLPRLRWEICAPAGPVQDMLALALTPTQTGQPLAGFDLVIVPGGFGSRALLAPEALLYGRAPHRD